MGTRPQGGECRGDQTGPIARRYSLAPIQLTIDNGQLTIALRRVCTSVRWTGRVGCLDWTHPFVGPGDQTGRPYILRNVLFMGCGDCINLSKRQMNRPRRGFLAPKYELVTTEGLLGRFVFCTVTAFLPVLFPPVSFSVSSVSFRRSFHTDGRNITHRKSCPFGL